MLLLVLMLGCNKEPQGWDWLLCSEEVDADADWVVDGLTRYAYDEHGQEILAEEDEQADGVMDRAWHTTWSPDGHMLSYTWDEGADGVPEHVESWTWDEAGHYLQALLDADGDGTTDAWTEYTWEGDLLVLEEWGSARYPEVVYAREYDYDGGHRVLMEEYWPDEEAPHFTQRWEYDDRGFMARTQRELHDGRVHYVVETERDDQGEVLDERWDWAGDGDMDEHYHWGRTAAGEPLLYEADHDADGTVDLRSEWTRDELGQELSVSLDQDADGVVDRRSTTAWDEWGHPTWESLDTDMDDLPDARTTYTWAAVCE